MLVLLIRVGWVVLLLFYSYLRTIVLEFYLIMNVAVGGTSGWFPEGQGNKPWLDKAERELPILLLHSSQLAHPVFPIHRPNARLCQSNSKMVPHLAFECE